MSRNTTNPGQANSPQPEFATENPDMTARFVPTSRHVANTFEEPNLRKYVLAHTQGRALNVCAGPTQLSEWYTGGDIVRNDLHPEIESDLSVDIAELACEFPPNTFDTIIFDPPWSAYQSRMRFDGYVVHKATTDDIPHQQISIDVRELPFTAPGEYGQSSADTDSTQLTLTNDTYQDSQSVQPTHSHNNRPEKAHTTSRGGVEPHSEKDQLGHARLAKLGFDYLLKEHGRVIQFAYTGSVMAASLGYDRLNRTAFDPTGTYKTLIGGVDRKQ